MAGELIFITGGTGFFGRHLVSLLAARGYKLRLLVRPTSQVGWLEGLDVELIYGDVTNKEILKKGMKNCIYVVHAAGRFRFWGSVEDFNSVNVVGTQMVCEAALEVGVQRLVHVSTIAIIGKPAPNEIIDENTACHPQDAYQMSKKAAEEIVFEKVAKDGLPAIIIRPGAYYGPGGRYGFNRLFIEEPMRGLRILVDNGERKTFPVFLPDVAEAVLSMLLKGREGEVYNVSDRSISHAELNFLLSPLLGISQWRLKIPRIFLYAFAGMLEIVAKLTRQEPYYPLNLRHYVFNDWDVSSEKARVELGFIPTPLEEGLKQTVAWYKDGHWKEVR
ncbi:MAG: NAD-dependent epimerase/dehydratase family protein [Chloroflexi bacterium]|nr:NAD-dependent epimerase/dehydratase family protein [Chloroflexota bacterium]